MLSTMSPTLRRFLVAALAGSVLVALVFGFGGWARAQLGIELDIESVRTFAAGLGVAGPLLFVLLVAGRSFLALPSQVVLIAAGLCFGTFVGAIVGGTGLMLSGLALFLFARHAGREAVERRLGARGRHLLGFASRRSGAITLAIASGHPITPLSPIQAAAGLTPMQLASFVPAALIGGVVRAAIFASFGDALLHAGWSLSLYAAVLFLLVAAIPLAFPAGRTWLREIVTPRPGHATDSTPNRP